MPYHETTDICISIASKIHTYPNIVSRWLNLFEPSQQQIDMFLNFDEQDLQHRLHLFQIVVHQIKPLNELIKTHASFSLASSLSEQVVKSLSEPTFKYLSEYYRKTNLSDDELSLLGIHPKTRCTQFYCAIILRYSTKQSEFDYVRRTGIMMQSEVVRATEPSGRLYKMASKYFDLYFSKR